jgi:hypothetical protein
MASTSTSLLDALDGAAKLAQVYGAYVWAYLLLVAALVTLLRRDPSPVWAGNRLAVPPGPSPPSLEQRAPLRLPPRRAG